MKYHKILVTGAGGFIGSHLAKDLYNKGHHVVGVDVKWDGYIKEQYCTKQVTLDLRNKEAVQEVIHGIDDVYHLAANMGGVGYLEHTGGAVMYDNVMMNAQMLEYSRQYKVKRFFFSSSACIYPTYRQTNASVTALKEEDAYPADPDNYYGWEKLYMEKMMEAYHRDYGMEVRIARFHNVYGPEGTYDGGREKSPAAVCRKVAQSPNPGTIEIWGDGKQTRSYCYIDDCVLGIQKLMESDFSKPLNIGTDRLISLNDLADLVIGISGKSIKKAYKKDAPQGVRGRNSDNTLIRKVLDWEPEISLEAGFEKTYRWIAEQLSSK